MEAVAIQTTEQKKKSWDTYKNRMHNGKNKERLLLKETKFLLITVF